MLNDNNANLLIVDDLPGNLLALEALIRQPDRTVFQASSGEEALALLLEHEFALAILDVQMPGMNSQPGQGALFTVTRPPDAAARIRALSRRGGPSRIMAPPRA